VGIAALQFAGERRGDVNRREGVPKNALSSLLHVSLAMMPSQKQIPRCSRNDPLLCLADILSCCI
jgi:hypothetical protein